MEITLCDLPGHMVTALLQLYYSLATVTPLPALLFCHLHQAIGLFVFWAFPSCVEFAAAEDAYFRLTGAASCILTAIRKVCANPGRLDPLPAALGRAV